MRIYDNVSHNSGHIVLACVHCTDTSLVDGIAVEVNGFWYHSVSVAVLCFWFCVCIVIM